MLTFAMQALTNEKEFYANHDFSSLLRLLLGQFTLPVVVFREQYTTQSLSRVALRRRRHLFRRALGHDFSPSSPPSGPRSMTQSADLITSKLCSITSTEWPMPRFLAIMERFSAFGGPCF
jgi:hypothetical protein